MSSNNRTSIYMTLIKTLVSILKVWGGGQLLLRYYMYSLTSTFNDFLKVTKKLKHTEWWNKLM